jgi:small subunit ribosomal protein S15e
MADASGELSAQAMMDLRKKRTFKKFTFRGVELESLLDLSNEVSGALLRASLACG